MLADTKAKQSLHSRDLNAALAAGTTVRLTELLPAGDYPSAQHWDAFYGQSLSIVDYLVRRKSPLVFVQFVDAARTGGYDRALRDYYGIHDMRELDRLWNASVNDTPVMLAKTH